MPEYLCISDLMKDVSYDCSTRNLFAVQVILYILKMSLVYTYPDKAWGGW